MVAWAAATATVKTSREPDEKTTQVLLLLVLLLVPLLLLLLLVALLPLLPPTSLYVASVRAHLKTLPRSTRLSTPMLEAFAITCIASSVSRVWSIEENLSVRFAALLETRRDGCLIRP